MTTKKYKIIDLFCGIGGFSKGFLYEGFEVVAGFDSWNIALETFKSSHPSSEAVLGDIQNFNNKYREKYKGIDVIIAGPPCQGFSMSGKREIGDQRNTLFEEVIRVASIIKPKIVIIENVVGLLSMKNNDGILIKDIIIDKLNNIGYHVKYKILDASHYGVPQKRKRVIFIASKDNSYEYPAEIKTIVTVGEALGDLPDAGSEKYLAARNMYQKLMHQDTINKKIYNHDAIQHNDLITKRMSFIPQGGNWKDIPIELGQGGGQHSNNYRRLKWDEPSITMKHATKSMIVHPIYNRCLTPREAARLQSFGNDFILEGSKFEQHQQLANAVPPLLGKAIAASIKNYLKNHGKEKN